ncbi:50S ribosomal protein L23 [Candidatus Sumerlaeota bacterium]|nr:50S ribosomal protein L23 [Candidatus Sumerlaeota bacterium]
MKSPYEILIRPVITEKASQLSESDPKQYVFRVQPGANKVEIRRAVEIHYNVKVRKVNTINMLGKKRRLRYVQGRRPSWKKAIVTLEPGQDIHVY